jgi:hypothetical protein
MQPGNYLAQLLDEAKNLKPKLSPADWVRVRYLIKTAKSAVCFQLPLDGQLIPNDMGLHTQDLAIDGFMRPPFDVIAVEYDLVTTTEAAESVVVIALHDEEADGVICIPSSKVIGGEDSWRIPAFAFFYPYKGFGVRAESRGWAHAVQFRAVLPDAVKRVAKDAGLTVEDLHQKVYRDDASFLARGYFHLCAALATHEVTFTDVEPDAAKNKMRRARGKVPLFTYKVLTIGKPKRKSRHLGGTHASPRSHLRRGYYRTSRNGVRHWVQPCMVKGETDGFVHKDYKVEGTVH